MLVLPLSALFFSGNIPVHVYVKKEERPSVQKNLDEKRIDLMTGYVIAQYKKTFLEMFTKSGFLPTITTPISLGII